jgi:hypothetical protein
MPPNDRPRPYPTAVSIPAQRRRPVAQRRAERAEREEARWQAKYAKAVTPAQRAAVDFDRVRAAIRDVERVDPERAVLLWAELSTLLQKLRAVSCRDGTPRRR